MELLSKIFVCISFKNIKLKTLFYFFNTKPNHLLFVFLKNRPEFYQVYYMWSGRRDSASKLSQVALCSKLSQMCLVALFFLIPSANQLRREP